jgi:hypothetical protein
MYCHVPSLAIHLQSLSVRSLVSVKKEFSCFEREADAGMPVHDVAKAQERIAEACDTSIGSAQRSEDNVAICISLSLCAPPAFVPAGHFTLLCNIRAAVPGPSLRSGERDGRLGPAHRHQDV